MLASVTKITAHELSICNSRVELLISSIIHYTFTKYSAQAIDIANKKWSLLIKQSIPITPLIYNTDNIYILYEHELCHPTQYFRKYNDDAVKT